jgi:hypothetical protein
MMRAPLAFCLAAGALVCAGCRDVSGFSTGSGSLAGPIVDAPFVRAGVDGGISLCLTLDTDHLQDTPGVLSTSDGRFHAAPMRPIPQIWQDPLSTLTFGEGRLKNLVYVTAASSPFADGSRDVVTVVSLMQSGEVEVRLIRGAPTAPPDGGAGDTPGDNVFAVFDLTKQTAPCSY